jgi:B9 domain-containing protein 2
MPEVSIVGTLRGASFLPAGAAAAFCRWRLEAGPGWTLTSGSAAGQTQVAEVDRGAGGWGVPPLSLTGEFYEAASGAGAALWEHPIDAHFSTSSLRGWPQLVVTVWTQDGLSRNEVVGYGAARVPPAPGAHGLEVATWRPEGTWAQELRVAFLESGLPQLEDERPVWDPAAKARSGLCTSTSATVEAELHVLAKGFAEQGVALAP